MNELRRINYVGNVARIEEIRDLYALLVGITTGKRAKKLYRRHTNISVYKIGCGFRN
jgi:hypothetical protein